MHSVVYESISFERDMIIDATELYILYSLSDLDIQSHRSSKKKELPRQWIQ